MSLPLLGDKTTCTAWPDTEPQSTSESLGTKISISRLERPCRERRWNSTWLMLVHPQHPQRPSSPEEVMPGHTTRSGPECRWVWPPNQQAIFFFHGGSLRAPGAILSQMSHHFTAKDTLLLGPAVLGDPRAVLRGPCRSVPSHQRDTPVRTQEMGDSQQPRTQIWDGERGPGPLPGVALLWPLPLAQGTGLWVEAVTPAKLDRLKPWCSHATLQTLG